MAEVLAPTTSPSPHTPPTESPESTLSSDSTARPQMRSHLSASNRSGRLSSYSRRASRSQSRSRPQSTVFPAFPSSLAYALVRDFAYPPFHPMHYGPPPEEPSGATTPGSEWNNTRRVSDPMDASSARGPWGAGPWGGDGAMYPDAPRDAHIEALPATSFVGDDLEDDSFSLRTSKHRKSKSYASFPGLDRGRRRDSNGLNARRSRMGGGAAAGDPDSHPATTLPSRSFHTSQTPPAAGALGIDEDPLPLDAEQSAHAHSPQRASMGPEDELYAGESLALYAFEPENPNELRLREGQIILVSYRHGQGWLVAEDPESGEQGLVPEEYVRLVREIESWDLERGGFIDDDAGGIGGDDDDDGGHDGDEGDERGDTEQEEEEEEEKKGEREDDKQAQLEAKDQNIEHNTPDRPGQPPPETSKTPPDIDQAHGPLVRDPRGADAVDLKAASLFEGRQDSAHGDS